MNEYMNSSEIKELISEILKTEIIIFDHDKLNNMKIKNRFDLNENYYQVTETVFTRNEYGGYSQTYIDTFSTKEEAQEFYNNLINNILPNIIKLDNEFDNSFYEENKDRLENEYIIKDENECIFKSTLFNICKNVKVKLIDLNNEKNIIFIQ